MRWYVEEDTEVDRARGVPTRSGGISTMRAARDATSQHACTRSPLSLQFTCESEDGDTMKRRAAVPGALGVNARGVG
jgi:hypothetical protein